MPHSMQYFRKSIKVKFYQADPAGILYFAELFNIAHDTFEDWIEDHIGIPWANWFLKKQKVRKNTGYLIPLRHVSCDYFSPFFPGKSYIVEVRLAQIQNSSFEVHYLFFPDQVKKKRKLKMSESKALLKMVHVFMDQKKKMKRTIPLSIRKKLQPHLQLVEQKK